MKRAELWVIGVLLLVGGGLVWRVDGVPSNPHDFAEQCEACHLNIPQQQGEKLLFNYDIDYVCRYCHEELNDQNSHPSQMVPRMKIPDGFPLDWMGRVTCATCHDPHAENWGVNRNLLRGEVAGRDFCILCHDEFKQAQGLHLIAEIVHSRKESEPSIGKRGAALDAQSSICVSCHDEAVGMVADPGTSIERAMYRGRNMGHPIGFKYAEATRHNRKYIPVGSLPAVITLVEGKVGCTSCHNPYSREKFMLVMSNSGSALCLACHDL